MFRLKTDRLLLMPLVESNRDEFRSLLINPDVIRWCFDLPSEGEVSRKFAERIYPGEKSGWRTFAVRCKNAGTFLGVTGYKQEGYKAEIGFLFCPESHGNGYATESLGTILDFGYFQGVEEFVARVTEGNKASCRVLEKCGFHLTARREAAVEIAGAVHGDLVYVHKPAKADPT